MKITWDYILKKLNGDDQGWSNLVTCNLSYCNIITFSVKVI